jgi:hypothetical protein
VQLRVPQVAPNVASSGKETFVHIQYDGCDLKPVRVLWIQEKNCSCCQSNRGAPCLQAFCFLLNRMSYVVCVRACVRVVLLTKRCGILFKYR